ncbi:MAG: crotonase/enoyl-CoA hydratase family protein [Nitriliruptor sp.]|nr:MAG: crotonase/enoyl-CoA hydratase family protein [Nitriliruptor sp.]
MTVDVDRSDRVGIVRIDRPEVRNAVDRPTADALRAAVQSLDADEDLAAIVLTGRGGTFCAGADLYALDDPDRRNRLERSTDAPLGPTRTATRLPTIAAVEGHAVAGGLELALWCDLRVVAEDAVLGVFCRRVGVPLIDGGTARLPRIVGLGVALDLVLTGRAVDAAEAARIGLANRVVAPGTAEAAAVALGNELARWPRRTLLSDLAATRAAFDRALPDALLHEHDLGVASLAAGGAEVGVRAFRAGAGRHGRDDDLPGAP